MAGIFSLLSVLAFGYGVFYGTWKRKWLPIAISPLPIVIILCINALQ
ncbi:hypothetical protein [Proteus mirabilis]|jgi:hypothetical protein|nr:hypothetical protein [Proteus mirabilis]